MRSLFLSKFNRLAELPEWDSVDCEDLFDSPSFRFIPPFNFRVVLFRREQLFQYLVAVFRANLPVWLRPPGGAG
jgi:hypothetical protein